MTRHVLMCEPVHCRIAYEINPWMRRANQVDGARALEQWRRLRAALVELGVEVELVEQAPDVPDMTFTANAGVALGRRYFPANFRFPERQLEEARFSNWFVLRGYTVEAIHRAHYWEGEGDVLPQGATVFAGHRFRTEEAALDHLDELLQTEVVRLALVDPRFYHLDTAFCPLSGDAALYVPGAFDAPSRRLLAECVPDLVAVPEAEAARFACNALVVDAAPGGRETTVVLNTGCPATEAALRERGLRPVTVPTDEFIKAGGSVKCLVLMLDAFTEVARAAPMRGWK
ncbi:MAG: arginine deiminase-related protein [Chloroflexi bacterium]|nr:arginine deiminase-related protein [Chloroflexota bacterium]